MMIDLSARHKQIATMEVRLDEVKSNIEKAPSAEEKMSQMNSLFNLPILSPQVEVVLKSSAKIFWNCKRYERECLNLKKKKEKDSLFKKSHLHST